jgi:hypothetical protein
VQLSPQTVGCFRDPLWGANLQVECATLREALTQDPVVLRRHRTATTF